MDWDNWIHTIILRSSISQKEEAQWTKWQCPASAPTRPSCQPVPSVLHIKTIAANSSPKLMYPQKWSCHSQSETKTSPWVSSRNSSLCGGLASATNHSSHGSSCPMQYTSTRFEGAISRIDHRYRRSMIIVPIWAQITTTKWLQNLCSLASACTTTLTRLFLNRSFWTPAGTMRIKTRSIWQRKRPYWVISTPTLPRPQQWWRACIPRIASSRDNTSNNRIQVARSISRS